MIIEGLLVLKCKDEDSGAMIALIQHYLWIG